MKFSYYEKQGQKFTISDGVESYQAGGTGDTMREVAEAFAATYDGADDEMQVAKIESKRSAHVFAFDGNGNFEWNTTREYVSY